MAISNQLFNAPVPKTYDPARDIERSFQKTSDLVVDAMTQDSERKQQERANFNEMYANIGELDAQLQENYAGMQQQMVTTTKDWLKEQIKKGVSTNDPELVRELSQRTGRIKASMGNADRNRKQLTEALELIKNDPTILDKDVASYSLMQMMNDPDFLISKNPFNAPEFIDKFVDPRLVFLETAKQFESGGSYEEAYIDEKGNEKIRKTAYSNLTNKENPFNPDGSLNVNIPPAFVQGIKNGDYGNRILQQTKKIVERDYADLPIDQAFEMALRDGFGMAVGSQVDVTVRKTAGDRAKEAQQMNLQNKSMQLRIDEQQRRQDAIDAKGTEQEQEFKIWNDFVEGIETNDNAILGEFNIPRKTRKTRYITAKETEAYKDFEKVSSQEKWEKTPRPERKKILEKYEVTPPATPGTGRWWTEDEDARKQLITAMSIEDPENTIKNKDKVVQIAFDRYVTTQDGQSIWETETLNAKTESDIINAFKTLENYRRSGQSKVEPTEIPEEVDLNTDEDFDYSEIEWGQ